jgi:hypothetical protein
MKEVQDFIWNGILSMYEGFMEKDRPKIDQFINEDCTVWDSSERDLAFGLSGLNEVRARRPEGDSGPQVEKIDAYDPVINVFEDFAVVRHYLRVTYKNDELPSREIRNTGVWRKFPQGWQIIHGHEDELPISE